ncbi:MAG TPA: sulfurtransferase TusA family protein [Azospirillaceae bacterium]|nr:sulfurtransferase TusA family protein [Azospirillaceae bacterium]
MTQNTVHTTHFIDVTSEVCPLTFVRTKLALQRLHVGEVLEIRLNPGEPLENVPRSLTEHGHTVLSVAPEDPAAPNGPHRLAVRKR